MGTDRTAKAPEWIVCLGAHRDVIEGAVRCGRVARVVSIDACRGCHYLAGIGDERGADNWCSTPEGVVSPDGCAPALTGSM